MKVWHKCDDISSAPYGAATANTKAHNYTTDHLFNSTKAMTLDKYQVSSKEALSGGEIIWNFLTVLKDLLKQRQA
jgi:hypothetical protein